ncbi:hypothetical protein GE253_22865 [Niveispirillum sp. SYP-B3756]|uniref:secretion/conjugation apparatus DotM-related subunit n=1 Tax=Niveispirillum sp. SYP-B3756 TaxID=2662178 RepID=UPI001292130A|nr:hypothetical protein [Niveispirillum sp. SYP-B3756]MQP68164.1 hypothetical protein [Niveispirillum sp. SYP-B3756]
MANNQSPNPDTTLIVVVGVTFLLVLTLWLVWSAASEQISTFVVQLKKAQLAVLVPFADHLRPLDHWLASTPRKWTPTELIALCRAVGETARWPIAASLIAMAIFVLLRMPTGRFRNRLGLEELIGEQVKVWPVIKPIMRDDPRKFDRRPGHVSPGQDLGPWGWHLTPQEWLDWIGCGSTFDNPKVSRALETQLGPRWNGVADLPQHIRALMAAFALKIVRDRDGARDLLAALSYVYARPQLAWWHRHQVSARWPSLIRRRFEKVFGYMRRTWPAPAWPPGLPAHIAYLVEDTLAEHEQLVASIASRHAWRTTAMLRLLQVAREKGGVVAPSEFIWLKNVDRALWYPMHDLGMRRPHAEAAGAMEHYWAELEMKEPVIQPIIVNSLAAAAAVFKERSDAISKP